MCDKPHEQKMSNESHTIDQISRNMNDLSLDQAVDCDYEDFGEGTSSGYCRSHSKYARDSLDRFGDDLIELILSYLSFSDKVSLESVSKQWQRTIYAKQKELQLNRSDIEEQNTLNKLLKPIEVINYATGFAHYAGYKAIDKQSLKSILEKCPFINTIGLQCYVDGDDLQMIGKYCPYLKSLECNAIGLSEKNLIEFGSKYGDRLRTMRINDSSYCSVFIKKFLNYCPNLKEVYTDENSAFISEEKDFLPKLEIIKSLDMRTENLMRLRILAEKYYNTMKNIKIYTYHVIGHQLKSAIAYISRFENLENLELGISIFDEDTQTIDESIVELAKNCTKLKTLYFNINSDTVITNRFFYAFGKFCAMERLNLEFYEATKILDGSIECFKLCPNLKHLVLRYKQLSEQFFDNIHLFVPNLRTIEIDSEKEITDRLIYSLSKLKKLQNVIFRQNASAHKSISDDSICELINSCQEIKKISFNARPNISLKTIDTLIASALKRPKINIDFSCGFSVDGDEATFAQIDVNSFADRMPENLKISIELGQLNNQPE